MHLHQELEGFYLGMRDNRARPTDSSYPMEINPSGELMKRGLRHARISEHASTKKTHGYSVMESAEARFVLLILEDFDEIRAFLSRHFARDGYDVFSSATLRDALAIAWEESPQVILIDYDLCGETAIHAIERLHEARPDSFVVLIGGPGTPEVEEIALAAGASKVLSKAYAISEMDQIVEQAMHLPVDTQLLM